MSKKISTKALVLGIIGAVAVGYGLRQTADREQVAQFEGAPSAIEQTADVTPETSTDSLQNASINDATDAATENQQQAQERVATNAQALNELTPAAGESEKIPANDNPVDGTNSVDSQ